MLENVQMYIMENNTMSDIKGNGAATDIDRLEGTLQELGQAEKKARKLWEKLTAELDKCNAERVEIALQKRTANKQIDMLLEKQVGGKRI